MAIYKCRAVKPKESPWEEVEAETPEQAANTFHFDNDWKLTSSCIWEKVGEDGKRLVKFALIEVEGYDEWVSRTYEEGIFRKGGVPRNPPRTVSNVAKEIGWTKDPAELLRKGWDFEEG